MEWKHNKSIWLRRSLRICLMLYIFCFIDDDACLALLLLHDYSLIFRWCHSVDLMSFDSSLVFFFSPLLSRICALFFLESPSFASDFEIRKKHKRNVKTKLYFEHVNDSKYSASNLCMSNERKIFCCKVPLSSCFLFTIFRVRHRCAIVSQIYT